MVDSHFGSNYTIVIGANYTIVIGSNYTIVIGHAHSFALLPCHCRQFTAYIIQKQDSKPKTLIPKVQHYPKTLSSCLLPQDTRVPGPQTPVYRLLSIEVCVLGCLQGFAKSVYPPKLRTQFCIMGKCAVRPFRETNFPSFLCQSQDRPTLRPCLQIRHSLYSSVGRSFRGWRRLILA